MAFINFFVYLLCATSSPLMDEDGWILVPRPERVPHQLEEEDRSVWVVFSKQFGDEHVLIRFPEDPSYRHRGQGFEAAATHWGTGEFALLARKKTPLPGSSPLAGAKDIVYRDEGQWIWERHIETENYLYILRSSHPQESKVLFQQFADSFEVE